MLTNFFWHGYRVLHRFKMISYIHQYLTVFSVLRCFDAARVWLIRWSLYFDKYNIFNYRLLFSVRLRQGVGVWEQLQSGTLSALIRSLSTLIHTHTHKHALLISTQGDLYRRNIAHGRKRFHKMLDSNYSTILTNFK